MALKESQPNCWPKFALMAIGLAVGMVGSPGCSCSRSPKPEKPKDELVDKKKPKPDFESKRILVSPSHVDGALQGMKPGHWYNANQRVKANNFDFLKGELDAFTTRSDNRPFVIENTDFTLRVLRPAALPKGQEKNFELTYFAPTARGPLGRISLHSDLRYAGGGVRFSAGADAVTRMRPHQYYLVVLADNPDSYRYLKFMHTVNPPSDEMSTGTGILSDYLITVPDTEMRVDLPTNPFAWSSLAYVVWDGFDGGKLSRDQQRALIDWIQWGGQLLVSGPDSLDSLRSSFLGKLLPVRAGKAYPLNEERIAELDSTWSLAFSNSKKNMQLRLNPAAPLEAVELSLQEDGEFVPGTSELIAERRVGRGRIVVTGFRMSSREFVNWGSYDNLVNNCLFRRPPRRFSYTGAIPRVEWLRTGVDLTPVSDATDTYAGDLIASDGRSNRAPVEALLTSKIRYFSRDAEAAKADDGFPLAKSLALDINGYYFDKLSGVGGWNDDSPCASLAQATLTESGGIEVPNSAFILKVLGGYLIVLVPVNWLLFRIMGRVEWAWFAVPLIAVSGTFLVVRLAQLDIGFVRSRTELCVLETQPNYERGHLTRFTALYASLSTNYQFGFSDSSALALPFGRRRFQESGFQGTRDVTLRLGGNRIGEGDNSKRARVTMQGFAVPSNNTGMVHSEQMFNMGGKLTGQLSVEGDCSVVNNSDYGWRDVAVIARQNGTVLSGWLGDLMPQEKKTVRLVPVGPGIVDVQQWEESEFTKKEIREGELRIRDLLRMAISRTRLNEGDVRMTGWTDQELPGMTVHPRSSQKTFRTVIVANLVYGPLPSPVSDENSFEHVKSEFEEGRDLEQP